MINITRRMLSVLAAIVLCAAAIILGAIGIARTFAYGGKNGRSLEDSIEHFHDKLLLLKDGLNTETAKKMAEERHRFLEEFLVHFEDENPLV